MLRMVASTAVAGECITFNSLAQLVTKPNLKPAHITVAACQNPY